MQVYWVFFFNVGTLETVVVSGSGSTGQEWRAKEDRAVGLSPGLWRVPISGDGTRSKCCQNAREPVENWGWGWS